MLKEADIAPIIAAEPSAQLKKAGVAIIGYGSQAHAHAQNLHDNGIPVWVGLREGSPNWSLAEAAGLSVCGIAEAARQARVISLLIPDEAQPELYQQQIAPILQEAAQEAAQQGLSKALVFAHGLNVHFGLIEVPAQTDVVLVAPKGPGRMLRRLFLRGGGLPAVFAVHQDASHQARALTLDYARGIGCARLGLIETTFKEECETDLFGEQSVLCGGIPQLILAGFETLVEAGYCPEVAYFETVHEVKLIIDLIYEEGFAAMRERISNTAEYGGYQSGQRIVTEQTKDEMRRVLADIQSGSFAERFMSEARAGFPYVKEQRAQTKQHEVERAGENLRQQMPFVRGVGNETPSDQSEQ